MRELPPLPLHRRGARQLRGDGEPLVAYIDGAARGNPGESGFGVSVGLAGGAPVINLFGYLGHQTNNFAEYVALLAAITYALAVESPKLEVRSDSQLVVRQILGVYKVKSESVRPLHTRAMELWRQVPERTIVHVFREQNKMADKLANIAVDRRGLSHGFLLGLPGVPPDVTVFESA